MSNARKLAAVATALAAVAIVAVVPYVARYFRMLALDGEAASRLPLPVDGWPSQVNEIRYASSADYSVQPALFFNPGSEGKRPLLVALHTWSGDYRQGLSVPYARWCIEKGWVFIHPHFRGPNWTPEATGSDLVVGDILSAVRHARKHANVDADRVYLVGVSGGGHAALLMAGRSPGVWAGVSAWVPISDLRAWHGECTEAGRKYAAHVEKSCGGPPGQSPEVDRQYEKRSPLTYLREARGLPLDINAGIRDGHDGSVPVSHSLRAFNKVAEPADRLGEDHIRYITDKAEISEHLIEELDDPAYGDKKPLLRRTSGAARLTVFDGGHEIVYDAAMSWLSGQSRDGGRRR
jgi:acetyl esterase/lipase